MRTSFVKILIGFLILTLGACSQGYGVNKSVDAGIADNGTTGGLTSGGSTTGDGNSTGTNSTGGNTGGASTGGSGDNTGGNSTGSTTGGGSTGGTSTPSPVVNYCGGSGTASDPYLICTMADLVTMTTNPPDKEGQPYQGAMIENTYFLLANDIVLPTNMDTNVPPSPWFDGSSFDGNNHKIVNLKQTLGTDHAGNGIGGALWLYFGSHRN